MTYIDLYFQKEDKINIVASRNPTVEEKITNALIAVEISPPNWDHE